MWTDWNRRATTGGQYKRVGELYGFPIKVVSERTLKEGLEFIDNRFVIEGNYKYTYNNGHLAMADTHAAATNFLNALERIPGIIDQYKEKIATLEREIPQLQEIAGKTWYSWSWLRRRRKARKRTGKAARRNRRNSSRKARTRTSCAAIWLSEDRG